MSQEPVKRARLDVSMADVDQVKPGQLVPEANQDHSQDVLFGLNKLRAEKILCDITLIAEGNSLYSIFMITHFIGAFEEWSLCINMTSLIFVSEPIRNNLSKQSIHNYFALVNEILEVKNRVLNLIYYNIMFNKYYNDD